MTNSVHSGLDQLLVQARSGDPDALGELLERHRGFLKVLAQRMLGGRVQARLDASDVVQRTCLSVQEWMGDFRGETTLQFLAWLRQIHEGNVKKALREHLAQKRDVAREGRGAGEEIKSLIADSTQSTPSQRVLRAGDSSHRARKASRPRQTHPIFCRDSEGKRTVRSGLEVTGECYVEGLGHGVAFLTATPDLDCTLEIPLVDGETAVQKMRLTYFTD